MADGRIAAVGPRVEGDVVDAEGLMLCPGFVDLHAHSALEPFDDPLLTPKILQGFTTEVICPDGLAPAPVRDREARRAYLRALEGDGPPEWTWTTFAEYLDALPATAPTARPVGAARGDPRGLRRGCSRRCAARPGSRSRPERGCSRSGSSTSRAPSPTRRSSSRWRAWRREFGAPLVPHVRNEGAGVLDAVREMIEVSERSGAPLHLSHLKSLAGEELLEPLLDLVDGRRRDVRPVPLRRGRDAARVAAAAVGAAGRRRGDARPRARPRGAPQDRSATSRTGCRAGRTCSARSGRRTSSSPAGRSPSAAATPSRRCSTSSSRASSPRR